MFLHRAEKLRLLRLPTRIGGGFARLDNCRIDGNSRRRRRRGGFRWPAACDGRIARGGRCGVELRVRGRLGNGSATHVGIVFHGSAAGPTTGTRREKIATWRPSCYGLYAGVGNGLSALSVFDLREKVANSRIVLREQFGFERFLEERGRVVEFSFSE